MPFSAPDGNNNIFFTGTGDISESAGNAGVTVDDRVGVVFYDFGINSLVNNGTLTIDVNDTGPAEMLLIGTAGTQNKTDITNNGTMTWGNRTTLGTEAVSSGVHHASIMEKANISFSQSRGKSEPGQATLGPANNKPFFYAAPGSITNWYGVMNCSGGIGLDGVGNTDSVPAVTDDAIVNIFGGVWDCRRGIDRGGVGDQFLYSYTDALTVDGFTWIGNESQTLGPALIILRQPLLFINPRPINVEIGFTGSTSSANDLQLVIDNYPGVIGNSNAIDMTSATNNIVNTNLVEFPNSSKGSTLNFNTQDPGVARIIATQTVEGTVTDSAGAPFSDGVVATEDVNGTIYQSVITNGSYSPFKATITEWTPPGGTTPPAPEFFSPSGTDDDLWTIYAYTFEGIPSSFQNQLMRDIGGKKLNYTVLPDLSVTVPGATIGQAAGLGSITSLSELHYKAKEFKINNVGLPTIGNPISEVIGSAINMPGITLIVDGVTQTAFQLTGTTITIGTNGIPSIFESGYEEAATPEGGETNTITVARPTGTQDGHFMLLVVTAAQSENGAYTTPTGWNVVTSNHLTGGTPLTRPSTTVFSKMAVSEPVSYQITSNGNTGHVAQLTSYGTVDPNTQLDVAVVLGSSGAGQPDPNSVTTANDDALIYAIAVMDDGNQTASAGPTNFTGLRSVSTLAGAGAGE